MEEGKWNPKKKMDFFLSYDLTTLDVRYVRYLFHHSSAFYFQNLCSFRYVGDDFIVYAKYKFHRRRFFFQLCYLNLTRENIHESNFQKTFTNELFTFPSYTLSWKRIKL